MPVSHDERLALARRVVDQYTPVADRCYADEAAAAAELAELRALVARDAEATAAMDAAEVDADANTTDREQAGLCRSAFVAVRLCRCAVGLLEAWPRTAADFSRWCQQRCGPQPGESIRGIGRVRRRHWFNAESTTHQREVIDDITAAAAALHIYAPRLEPRHGMYFPGDARKVANDLCLAATAKAEREAAAAVMPTPRPGQAASAGETHGMPTAEVERLQIAWFIWAYIKPKEMALRTDADLAAEVLRDVLAVKDKDPDVSLELLKLIDTAGREWDGHSIDRALHPGISRGGLQCLAVLAWAERVVDAPPRRRQDFKIWCHRVTFGGDPAALAKPDQVGRSIDYAMRAERLNEAAAALGVVSRPPFGPLTFDELRTFAGELCDAMERPDAASVASTAAETPPAAVDTPTHSADFTSVDWFGTRYDFKNGQQADAVRELWAAWSNGTPRMAQATIGERIGSNADRFRMATLFRDHPAYRTMIVSAGKGVFILRPPTEPPEKHT